MVSISSAVWAFVFGLSAIMQLISDHAPLVEALGGAAVAAFTYILVRLGRRADDHFRVTERAYVKMSHITPAQGAGQALTWSSPTSFRVVVQIKNHGRTPARVTDVLLTHYVVPEGENFPSTIPYNREDEDPGNVSAFLVCDDFFRSIADYSISAQSSARIMADQDDLIFYGYVDYIDQFGIRHRAGYGRQYLLGQAAGNLGFPNHAGVTSLNYDRLRVRGEGNDWTLKAS